MFISFEWNYEINRKAYPPVVINWFDEAEVNFRSHSASFWKPDGFKFFV